ncbi:MULTISPECIES: AI-2E family transporter [unclassified Thioalkalivibrio]|uniref:AI-2E family transporter n=1 Tax=unclassified Thioalkalivibrio TaxID=2621013 RepID=UPI000379E7DE|nr:MULTISPECIES: AI-2E family transporter [unclassified Thioalkalivibrio]
MIEVLRQWYQRHFTDPQVVILAFLLLAGFLVIIFAGRILAPLLASLIIAYLLEGGVKKLTRIHVPRLLAVTLVLIAFLALTVAALFSVVPLLSAQVTQLVRELPGMIREGQSLLLQLPEHYPQLITDEQVRDLMGAIQAEATLLGQRVLSFSLSSARHIVDVVIYLIVVPLMVFFMLKDRDLILNWIRGFMPQDTHLASEVWREVNIKIASYVRGKFIEILIVWAVTFLTFNWFGLEYAVLLSFMVGISVIIPYIGAAVVTIPVAAVAYFQFGIGPEFAWILIAYGVIQFLDGNVLVPLLFSEVVNLHPVAIIAAVFVFGGIWGLWGVFFAIPLATLVHAVIKSWPRVDRPPPEAAITDAEREASEPASK